MRLRSPLPRPNIVPPFTGPPLREHLEQRTRDAVALVERLDLAAWTDHAGEPVDPAPQIADRYDVEAVSIDWDAGTVIIGASEDQRMRAVWAWTIVGDPALIACRPDSTLTGAAVDFGVAGTTMYATVTDWTLSAAQIENTAAEARRYASRYFGFVAEQVDRWRDGHRIRVRDAARKRRTLLEQVAELEAVTA